MVQSKIKYNKFNVGKKHCTSIYLKNVMLNSVIDALVKHTKNRNTI
jgi:hypothetical protein